MDDTLVWLVQQALRDADTYGDGSFYAQSPGQLPDHVHNRVARTVADRVGECAEERRDIERHEVTRLRGALARARGELDRWGHGDFRYGESARHPSVVAALADIDVVLAGTDDT